MNTEIWARTEGGSKRAHNEDAVCMPGAIWQASGPTRHAITRGDETAIVAVADGIGGQPGGALAARLVCEWLTENHTEQHDAQGWRRHLKALNADMVSAGTRSPGWPTMGATVAGIALRTDTLSWFNVGDSRIYRLRDGFARQLSYDDRAKHGSMLTQAIGGTRKLEPIAPHSADEAPAQGWRYLLTSDGIEATLSVEDIEAIAFSKENATVVDQLIDAALARGAPDNTTAALITIGAYNQHGFAPKRPKTER